MAVISFTESDKLAGKLVDKGGYTMMMTECEAKPSKKGTSINYWATFKITKGDSLNKELKITFNSATESTSLLGAMNLMPSRELLKLSAAVNNVPFKDVDLNLDTDSLLNRNFDGIIGVVPNVESGELMNVISAFFPEGKATGAPAF